MNEPAVALRAFRLEDTDAVRALWEAAGMELSPSDRREALAAKLERDPDLFLVAERGGRIVAAVIGAFDGRRGWIYHLAVAAEEQRRGLGARLMGELERRLRAKGCEKINLHVVPGDPGAIAFYETLGFGTNDLVFMEKWLR